MANQPPNLSERALVVKDNRLINAHYSMSVMEMRLFLAMVVQVKKSDKEFSTYRVRVRDLLDASESKSENLYSKMDIITDSLMKRYMRVPLEEGGFKKIGFVSMIEYKEKRGIVEVRFDPDLKPYLLQLKQQFTIYDIRNVLQLQSTHSVRIYEVLKQFERIGERTLEVKEIKEILGISGKYKSYNSFKIRVIEQAKKELTAKCDIAFDYEEIKVGRKVEAIRFIIIRQKKTGQTTSAERSPISDVSSDPVEDLTYMGLAETQAKKYATRLSLEVIQDSIEYTQQQHEAGNINRSISGYLVALLEAGGPGRSDFQKDQAARAAQTRADVRMRQMKEANVQQLIDKLREEFEVFREQQMLTLAKQATEAEWEQFIDYARENVFLVKKLFKQGTFLRDHQDALTWLGHFLMEQHVPDYQDAFIKWTYETHGYQIIPVEENGISSLRVVGKQSKLF